MSDAIRIRGARQHNLRGINLDLPRNRLIVFTGVSGSGKSSLAFDTLFAEGQRRYVESLSNYAKQFLANLPRPDVDEIEGLAPTIAIDQAARSQNPRSTVATITEIYDHLRVLYAAIGVPHCPRCGREIGSQSREAIVGRILALPERSRALMLAPVARQQRGEFLDLFEDMSRRGYVRARVDGEIIELRNAPPLDRYRAHDIEIVTDRIIIAPDARSRIAEAVERALELSEGTVIVVREGERDLMLSSEFACAECGLSFEEPTHAHFSFNSPKGMCPACEGLGERREFDPDLLVPDPDKSLREGAIELMRPLSNRRWRHWIEGVAKRYGFTLDTPWQDLTDEQRHHLLHGSEGELIEFYFRHRRGWEWHHADPWEGIIPGLMRRYKRTRSRLLRGKFEAAMHIGVCSACGGRRLRPESLTVTVGGASIAEVVEMTVGEARKFFAKLKLSDAERIIAEDALKEIISRLEFLVDVGLHYLSLERTAPTLAGGEAQRIRLASQVGSGLVDVLYILDEPSIGLHHRDQGRLLKTLEHLRDLGNTIIVVEHDEQTMRAADYIVDFGPGAGQRGGRIVARGTPEQVAGRKRSLTARYLSGELAIPTPQQRRDGNGKWLTLHGARHNNLKRIRARFPLARFICVTGVSGSGKSSLVSDTLHPALARELQRAQAEPGDYDRIEGTEHLEKVVLIDQNPIGRTPRSNPATYVGVFDHIRALYAQLPESRQRGYKAGRFSFNTVQGRCPACQGHGAVKLESDFLANVWVECDACGGRRFDEETLTIRYRGRSIAEVLEMEVAQAIEHFRNIPKIRSMLEMMSDVGLGYLKLGQPAPTLSGGEAQRVKLAEQLCRPRRGRSLYLLDEPTTGLHLADIQDLLAVLQRFVDEGNTVIVVEHHPDIIKSADWVIDLGPEGGAEGGEIVAAGTPEAIAREPRSFTGQMLRGVLGGKRRRARKAAKARVKAGADGAAICVHGAREHNLKSIDVEIPRHKLTAVSGVSGSGKSSLALDTVYAEGQRRYVESLSSYARQFVRQMQKPKVDRVTGLAPAIAIDQKQPSHNPRSTVGTVTTIYDYLRVLFARIATPHCPSCGAEVGAQTPGQIADDVIAEFDGQLATFLAPIAPRGNEQYSDLLERHQRQGWLRARVDGEIVRLPLERRLDRRRRHEVEIVVDRIEVAGEHRSRVAEAVETAVSENLGDGRLIVAPTDEHGEERLFSQHFSCDECGAAYEPLTPRGFSFNHREGWCPLCEGLGTRRGADPRALVPDPHRSLREGALSPWGPLRGGSMLERMLGAVAQASAFDLDTPFEQLAPEHQEVIFYGAGEREFVVDSTLRTRFLGLVPAIEQASRLSWHFRRSAGRILRELPCPTCGGGRVRPEAAAARLRGRSIVELCELPLDEAVGFFDEMQPTAREQELSADILEEIRRRLKLLTDVGLGYLTLSRSAPSLSGGESQRVRLAGQIGSGLTGVLYVLDEPTVGVHPRDHERTLQALRNLREMGNTGLVVEHDEQTLRAADHIIDLGPGAGPEGGHLVAVGTVEQVEKDDDSLTGRFLAGRLSVPVPATRRRVPRKPRNGWEPGWVSVIGARHHNLKDITAHFPLGVFTCVTGPSGSGKSSLVNEILYPELAYALHGARMIGGPHERVAGIEQLDRVINVDQAPIGQTPRSSPATYTGLFDLIRELFSMLPEARVRGYTPARFSFNRQGGRCEACEGMGRRRIEMHFLPDVWVECEVCGGRRYDRETLEVKYRGKEIAGVLAMTVGEALRHFEAFPRIRHILQTLDDVGLGYVPLGQPAPMLSGGEAQRVKLARELSQPARGPTLYLLDEPTTGLHCADIKRLLEVLQRLIEAGNTVVVIEHNLDVIKSADYVIDLGPGGGEQGGRVVASGPPERVARSKRSATAPFLSAALERSERQDISWLPMVQPPAQRAHREAVQAVGADVQRPWESDGEAWHLGPTAPEGHPRRWEPGALRAFVELASAAADDVEIAWADREFVTLRPDDARDWWARARTDYQWDLRLQFHTEKGRFDQDQLERQLGLPTWDAIEELPRYGGRPRVRVYTSARGHDSVFIWAFYERELRTEGFERLLRDCYEGYRRKGSGE